MALLRFEVNSETFQVDRSLRRLIKARVYPFRNTAGQTSSSEWSNSLNEKRIRSASGFSARMPLSRDFVRRVLVIFAKVAIIFSGGLFGDVIIARLIVRQIAASFNPRSFLVGHALESHGCLAPENLNDFV